LQRIARQLVGSTPPSIRGFSEDHFSIPALVCKFVASMSAPTPTVTCASCGTVHSVQESELTYGLPDEIYDLDEALRAERAKTSPDICMLDGTRMFVRGLIPLPVDGREDPYRIGACAEVSEEDFREIYSLWRDENQATRAPFKGTLANEIYRCPGSRGLALELRLTGPKTRPEIYFTNPTHDLCMQQRGGISDHQAYEYSDKRT
jgi:hypothetical protein